LRAAPRTDPYVWNYLIRLLPWVFGVKALVEIRVQNLGAGQPTVDHRFEVVPLAAGNPERVQAASVWRPLSPGG
jgi:hypothetical protein